MRIRAFRADNQVGDLPKLISAGGHPKPSRWREELLQLVCLLERLSPADLERFVLQRKAWRRNSAG
jgi:hypothetical protein